MRIEDVQNASTLITITNSKNVSVVNSEAKNLQVVVYNSQNILLENISSTSVFNGFIIEESSQIIIRDVTLVKDGEYDYNRNAQGFSGINLEYSHQVSITRTYLSGFDVGVGFWSGIQFKLTNSTFEANAYHLRVGFATDVTVAQNVMHALVAHQSESQLEPIYNSIEVDFADHVLIVANHISNAKSPQDMLTRGIKVTEGNNVTISHNFVEESSEEGVLINDLTLFSVINNSIDHTARGIQASMITSESKDALQSMILNNSVTQVDTGITLSAIENVSVDDNTLTSTTTGIALTLNVRGVNLTNNRLHTSSTGIYVSSTSEAIRIVNNSFTDVELPVELYSTNDAESIVFEGNTHNGQALDLSVQTQEGVNVHIMMSFIAVVLMYRRFKGSSRRFHE